MAWQIKRAGTWLRWTSTTVLHWSLLIAITVGAMAMDAAPVVADEDSPQFNRGACEGAYPGWLRGMADGYHDLSAGPEQNPTRIRLRVPTPEALTSADERLGYGDGLEAGFKLGVAYGVELGKAARTPKDVSQEMANLTAQFQAYIQRHCGDLVAALDWKATYMNEDRSSTVASLNEAQVAMHLAATANQMAIQAEDMARDAKEAQAKGDQPVFMALRAAAQTSARTAAGFAQMAKGHAAAGREEAVQPIIDAQSAAERAKKAADGIDG